MLSRLSRAKLIRFHATRNFSTEIYESRKILDNEILKMTNKGFSTWWGNIPLGPDENYDILIESLRKDKYFVNYKVQKNHLFIEIDWSNSPRHPNSNYGILLGIIFFGLGFITPTLGRL